jgi:hypothetical protein
MRVMGSGLALRQYLAGVVKNCMVARPANNIATHYSPARQNARAMVATSNWVVQDRGKYLWDVTMVSTILAG